MSSRIGQRCAGGKTSRLALKFQTILLILGALLFTVPSLNAQNGLGGYNLTSPSDLSFAFDYNGSGKADHIVLYRPGSGIIWILSNNNGAFTPVYISTQGIGGYDLKSPGDRIFAFDFNGSGNADHLVCYRPGTGTVWILQNSGGAFSPVFSSGVGIGDYDLRSTSDRMLAFDFDGSGYNDHLVLYRPGSGIIYVLKNENGMFMPVFSSESGIGGYDLMSTADLLTPFDYDSIGISDHLVAYRPGTGTIQVIENANGNFLSVFQSAAGIGDYDLKSPADRIIAFDYTGSGLMDHLLLYRPGQGVVYVLQQAYFGFSPVFSSNTGIGGYDLGSTADRLFAFDYSGISRLDHLVLYRPGTGVISIESNTAGTFASLPTH